MKSYLVGIIIAILLAVFFHYRLFYPQLSIYTSQDFDRGDLTHFNYPIKQILAESLKQGRLPLWTDKIFGGFPVFAEEQAGALYLPNLLLFWLLPTPLAFNLAYVFTSITAVTGMYAYCRFRKIGLSSSLIAMIGFSFSMYFIGHTLHLNFLQAASVGPWLFLLSEVIVRKPNKWYFVAFTFILSQQIFSGYIQLTIYILFAISLLLIYRLLTKEATFKGMLVFGLGIIAATALSAVQLLPTWEFFNLSIRIRQLPYEFITLFKYRVSDLAFFLYPFIFGDPSKASFNFSMQERIFWENNAYIGVLPLIFSIISIFRLRKRDIIFFLTLFAATILFSLGWPKFIFQIPPFATFRVPQKSLLIATFALSVMAAYGADAYFLWLKQKLQQQRIIYTAISVFLVLISFYDLLKSNEYNGVIKAKEWLAVPETAEFVKDRLADGRIFAVGQSKNWQRVNTSESLGWRSESAPILLATRTNLDPDTNVVYGVPSADGYAGTILKRTDIVVSLIRDGIKETENQIVISDVSAGLLSQAAVKYIISPKLVSAAQMELVHKFFEPMSKTTYYIYENKQVGKRIHAVSKLVQFKNNNDLQKIFQSENYDPQDTALVQFKPAAADFSSQVEVSNVNYTEDKITFSTFSPQSAFLVVADTFYPGWQTRIDAKVTATLPVNINQRGLSVDAGTHQIVMKYQPDSLNNGMWVSGMTVVTLGVVILYRRV